ncbi:MAG: DUF349 domain-containing protein [Paludibacteraceae bacterium]|nr:DUF349 domain-containing protein [Paludibacteraceae bacterium]
MDVKEQNVQNVTESVASMEEVSLEAIETADVVETPEYEDFGNMTEGELVEKAKDLMKSNPESYTSLRGKMDAIKYNFYKKLRAKNDELKQRFVDEGGLPEDFKPAENPLDTELKAILQNYKEKRAAEFQRAEAEKLNNLGEKKRILEDLKGLLENTEEDFGKKVPQFQKLQQEWKSVGAVPQSEVNALWSAYQLCVENFYDNLKINNELRDYDFRKNLEQKVALCEQAEALADEKDVIAAFRKLQVLHEEWREIGPVSRENRESIWNRFKEVSTVINKRHHDFFDKLRSNELENLQKKSALCEKIEAIDFSAIHSFKEWQEQSANILAIQEEWKKIGFAPKKDNVAIYERFRATCDKFFKTKNEYFRSVKDQLSENLAKKIELCEKAEANMDSTDWKATSDLFVKLQQDWKKIGAVPKKQSDVVWKRFLAACDHFFAKKGEQFKSQRQEQDENLKQKKALVEKIKSLVIGEDHEASFNELKSLIAEWNAVGHVPFKDKDKVYNAYKAAIDEKFEKLNVDKSNRRMDVFKASVQDMAQKGEQKLSAERKKLVRQYEALCADITNYENNIGFFSASSKSAESLIKDMANKIQKLKKERDMIVEKVKLLDNAAKKE